MPTARDHDQAEQLRPFWLNMHPGDRVAVDLKNGQTVTFTHNVGKSFRISLPRGATVRRETKHRKAVDR